MRYLRKIIKFLIWLRSSYFNYPFLFDIVVVLSIFTFDYKYELLSPILEKIDLNNLPSNLITGSLTLLGFFITAITIIMTLRGVYKIDVLHKNNDGVGIFFSSKKQYGNLLKVFRSAVWTVFVLFLFLVLIEAFGSLISSQLKVYGIISCLLLLITATIRSLYTLHLVINVISKE